MVRSMRKQQVERDMNSAKFIAACFGFMTLVTLTVTPALSAVSAMLCAGAGVCSIKKGINNTEYLLSAVILILMAVKTAWVMQ